MRLRVGAGCGQAPDASSLPSSSSSHLRHHHQSSSSGHRSGHHIRVPDDDAPAQPPELTQAEAAIEKQNYAAAESLLHKLVEQDATSYVGWFDLGFVENALGNVDASIAAYRKSVAAKPDVFESNLNLGLQLAKTGQPDAEKFLRAATRLKPTSHVEEGQYRAWLALGQTLEKSKPEEALGAYQKAAEFQPKEAEPHFAAGMLLEQENKFADAEQEYKRALELDPGSRDAVMGLANVYMRGRRFPEAEDYLRKLLARNIGFGGRWKYSWGGCWRRRARMTMRSRRCGRESSWLRGMKRRGAIWRSCIRRRERMIWRRRSIESSHGAS